ncbi:MAG: hypothetical protein ACUVTQ_09620 [Desulfotomaculales bacterium]
MICVWPRVKHRSIGGYSLTMDKVTPDVWCCGQYVVAVLPPHSMNLTVDWVVDLFTLGGADITGDGCPASLRAIFGRSAPLLLISRFSYLVFSLGPDLRLIPLPFSADAPAMVVDLGDDRIYEVLGWDPVFPYVYYGNAETPWLLVA